MAKKKQPKKPTIVYASGETPIIDFADFGRLSLGAHGILFEFGQNQPFDNKIVVTHQVIVPHDVAGRLHKILGDHLKEFCETVEKTMADTKKKS